MKSVIFSFFLFLRLLAEHKTLVCTAFCLNNGNQIVLAKNLDWSVDLGYIFINKSGEQKTSFNGDCRKINRVSSFGSITFNQFGKEFPLGGMNDQGLVIEELNMSPVKIIPDSSKSCLNEFQLLFPKRDWLSNFKQ